MRYLKDLIPKEHKVLPEYFQEKESKNKPRNQKHSPLLTTVGIIFFSLAIISIKYIFLAFLLALIGWFFTAHCARWMQDKARFKLTGAIRTGAVVFLLIGIIPAFAYYKQQDAVLQKQLQAERLKREKITADSLASENHRRDSLYHLLAEVKKLDPGQGFASLKRLEQLAVSREEKDTLISAKKIVSNRFAHSLIKKGRYKSALEVYDGLLNDFPTDGDILLERANCNLKAGNVKLAVADLTLAIDRGNQAATKLYNKVNPIRKRVAYYVTRCCDGTTSNATGRGACSWHGGVCNWSEPVYEEYRKY